MRPRLNPKTQVSYNLKTYINYVGLLICSIMHQNNPYNIRALDRNHWLGEITKNNYSFEAFDTMEHGVRAGVMLLRNYIRLGYCKPLSIISRWAPPSENNVKSYLTFISTFLPLDKDISYPSDEFVILCVAIARFESNTRLSKRYIYNILNKFKL